MAKRMEWRRNAPWRERESGRGWYDVDERRGYRRSDYGMGGGWESLGDFPEAGPGRADPYRQMDEEYNRWNREGAFRDYPERDFGYAGHQGGYSPGRYYGRYGYRHQYPYRDYDRDYDRDYNERGFFERAGDEVASWFGDEDAERRRQMDEFRGKGPKGYTRSDSRIQEDVSDRLSDDGALDASDIEVSVASGEVQLSGFVDSKWAKRRAEDCAEDVSGVTNVQNNIRVRTSESTSTWSDT